MGQISCRDRGSDKNIVVDREIPSLFTVYTLRHPPLPTTTTHWSLSSPIPHIRGRIRHLQWYVYINIACATTHTYVVYFIHTYTEYMQLFSQSGHLPRTSSKWEKCKCLIMLIFNLPERPCSRSNCQSPSLYLISGVERFHGSVSILARPLLDQSVWS